MDPLSITASAAALTALVQSAAKGIRFLFRPNEASTILLQVNNELADLHLLIGKIEYLCYFISESHSYSLSNEGNIHTLLERAKAVMLELEQLIAYKLTKGSSGDTPDVNRIAWLKEEENFKQLLQRLRAVKQDIAFAISVNQMQWLFTHRIRFAALESRIEQVVSSQLRLENTMTLTIQAITQPTPQPVSEPSSLTVGSMESIQSNFLSDLIHLGMDFLDHDDNGMSAYLLFWRPLLIYGELRRPQEQQSLFGNTLSLELFGLNELHAAVLDFRVDDRKTRKIMDATSYALIDELDATGTSALGFACERGDRPKITELLKMGADPNIQDKEGRTPLHKLASWNGLPDQSCIQELLVAGGDPNIRNVSGGTPLHDWLLNPHCPIAVLELVLCHGADPNIQDSDGHTPMHWAVRMGNLDAIEPLLRNGADPQRQSYAGTTILTYALVRHLYPTFRYLFEHGFVHNTCAPNGSSLLHFVAREADIDTLCFLQRRNLEGIDTSQRDQDGLTALQRAEKRRRGIYEWMDLPQDHAPPEEESELWFQAYVTLHEELAKALPTLPTGGLRRP
ncbi:hypothetical protein MMC25_004027 [Agyrium rufum]|nr:hypothetical protein [Agyrium rufum]